MTMGAPAMIGRWTTDQYLRLNRWWFVIGVAVIIATSPLGILPGSSLSWNALVFFLVGVMVARQHGGKTESLTSGALVGLALGFSSAVITIFFHPSAVAVVNIVAETLVTGLVAALIATCATLISQILLRQT